MGPSGGRHFISRPNVQRDIDSPAWSPLKPILGHYRNQMLVDEATDFSPIQLACMAALAHPRLRSFFTCGDFNQRLTTARRDLRLPQELAKLARFERLILDDIGYVQHDRDEMEVLFTLLAERYERKSVVITTNLVFSEWDHIFKDPMTAMAAIDRVVHHRVVLDLMGIEELSRQARSRIEIRRDKTAVPA